MQSFLVKTKAISRTITKQKVSSTSISSRALFGNEKCAFWRVIETQLVVSKQVADFRLYNSLTDHPGFHGAQKAIKFGGSANFSTGLQMKEQTCRTGAPMFKNFLDCNSKVPKADIEIAYLALLLQLREGLGETDGWGGGESSHWSKFLE